MKEKLVLQDIVDLLAKKTSLSKKEADAFFRELFSAIIDNVFNDDTVKIKDFGTFKLTKVSSRESVDVNTGEKIEIPAHYKISFLPDKALKTLVNKPFAHFETTLLEEGVSFDIEESEEPVDLTEDEDTSLDETDVSKIADEATKEIEDIPEHEVIESDIKDVDTKKPIKTDENKEATSSKGIKAEASPYPTQSFVYTYTSDSKTEEDSSVTIVVPTEKITSPSTSEKINAKEEDWKPVTENFNVKYVAETDATKDNGLSGNTPIEINKVQEKIDQLKEAIGSLTKANSKTDFFDEESSKEEQTKDIELENGLSEEEIGKPISRNNDEKQESDIIDKFNIAHPTESNINEDSDVDNSESITSSEGFDYEDTTPASSQSLEEDENPFLLEKQGADETPDEKESDEEYLDEYEFQDYYKETAFSRIRKKIPVIVILLAAIGVGGYQFYKLFNVKYSYENYRGYRDYPAMSDSLENESETIISPDSLNSIFSTTDKQEEIDDQTSTELLPSPISDMQSGNPPSDPNILDVTDIVSDSFEKIISDNLKIGVINKAHYIRNKEYEEGAISSLPNISLPRKETVQPKGSLRNIASRYYGSGSFWVYIYEENKAKIPDFNNLGIGTELTIPNLSKYGVNLNDPKAVEEAKIKEQQLFKEQKEKSNK